jgi:hypothetical protein
MNSKSEQRKNYYKGKNDARRGKSSNPPGVGFSKLTGVIIGAAFGPAGAFLGGVLGDGKRDQRNRRSYKKGYQKRKSR